MEEKTLKRILSNARTRCRKAVLETSVLLCDDKVFGDTRDHEYDVVCEDGRAVAYRSESEAATSPKALIMTYPKRSEVISNRELAKSVLSYRGLDDLKPSGLTYGDIMLALGTLSKPRNFKLDGTVRVELRLSEDELLSGRFSSFGDMMSNGRMKLGIMALDGESEKVMEGLGFDVKGLSGNPR